MPMSQPQAPERPKKTKARAIWIAAAAVVVIGAVYAFQPSKKPAPMQPPPVPVQTAIVARTDIPVFLEGLGTVQAEQTINVTSRVDGQLLTVNFTEGHDVKKGDILAQIDPRTYQAALDQARATKQKDEALLSNARLDLQRYMTLAPEGYTSKQILDTQTALVAQLVAQVKIDQAAIDMAATNLDYTTIRAPLDARTGINQVSAGNNVLAAANTTLVVLTQMHPILVLFTLPSEDLASIRKGSASGPLEVIAFARDGTELDRGELLVIDNQIIQTTGSLRLKANFPNANNNLWPGQFVNVRLLVETMDNALTVPSTAVQTGPKGQFVYLVRSDSTVAMQPVGVTLSQDGQTLIDKGLQQGNIVVAAGQSRLQAGSRIAVSNPQVASDTPAPPSAAP
jgi:multidrug efflux system membrane fusion protein